jgi:hypothetical protein
MDVMTATIIRLDHYRAPAAVKPKKHRRTRHRDPSVYDLYALPFLDKKARKTWAVRPTGRYMEDCDTGSAYGIAFLRTCDGTAGWAALVGWIVQDMIQAGPSPERWPDDHPSSNGIVVGFMGEIGRALAWKLPRA